jgi:hypothetical protein
LQIAIENKSQCAVTLLNIRNPSMSQQQATDKWFQDSAARAIHEEQLAQVERFNGRAAMLGIVIGVLTEALTGQGIIHQIGLGPLVDGYVACSTKYLPFCF